MVHPAEVRDSLLAELPRLAEAARPVREAYLNIVRSQHVPFTENLVDPHAWAVYVYYAELVARVVENRHARILDWGGGYGHVTALLRARGYQDTTNYLLFPPAFYDLVRRPLDIPTTYGKEPNVLALEDGSVDAVVSSGVLEHVREDGVGREDLVLKDIARVLRPGGLLFIWNLPTPFAAGDVLGKLRGRWYHNYRYSGAEARRLVEEAGFDVLHEERYGGTPMTLALKRALGEARAAEVLAWDLRLARLPFVHQAAQNQALVAALR